MLFDANVWFGNWPFQSFTINSPVKLAGHLEKEGISKALVASPESIFYPDPDQGNEILFKRTEKYQDLLPVPIVNPSLKNWDTMVGKYVKRNITAVKILPNYHCYQLSSPYAAECFAALAEYRILCVVQMRIEDERSQHPLCRIPGVDTDAVIDCAQRHSSINIAVSCAYFSEAVVLVEKTENVYVDISFVETMDTIACLLSKIPASRILFGSHTPFLYTRSAVMKVETCEISESDREMIRCGNISRLLN